MSASGEGEDALAESGAGAVEVDGYSLYVYDGDSADVEYLVGAVPIQPPAGGSPEVFEVIFVCSIDERTLVAVPQSAWNRRAEGRRFPPGSLVRATAVEVAAASRGARAERVPDARIKLWLGYLEDSLVEACRFDGGLEPTVEFATTSADSGFLPLGEALVEVAKDKFQFHSALSGNPGAEGRLEDPGETRLAKLESAMQAMTETMKVMKESLVQPTAKASLPLAAPRLNSSSLPAGPPVTSARPSGKSAASGVPVYPGLDAGVVQSALAAGVGHKALEEMAALLSANPARRLR